MVVLQMKGQIFNFHFWEVFNNGNGKSQDSRTRDPIFVVNQNSSKFERPRFDSLQVDKSAPTDQFRVICWSIERKYWPVAFNKTGFFRTRWKHCSNIVVRPFKINRPSFDYARVDWNDLKGDLTVGEVAVSSNVRKISKSGGGVVDGQGGLVVKLWRVNLKKNEIFAARRNHLVVSRHPKKIWFVPANA